MKKLEELLSVSVSDAIRELYEKERPNRRGFVDMGKLIDGSALQPGDLIVWSYPNNPRVAGRFMDIGHVAIYVQNGMMIEAAPSAGCVTYREMSV